MKKLAGLLAFAVALACAILITQYYSSSKKTPQAQPPPDMPPVSAVHAPPAAPPPSTAAPVTFKPQLITLDLASKKASATLVLERDPAATSAPERVWVWAYFFTQESPGRYCSGEPVEVKKPFDSGAHARVTVELPVTGCPTPRTASTTFYARVNVSTESAFAARLTEQRISYDISQASPVTLKGAGK
ncbi:MAG: hypothetical protein ACJ74Q_09300 [Pyrinomonadaceae bacterium]